MKKVFCLFCTCILVSSCSAVKQKSFICESEYQESSTETVYYYNTDEEVQSVLIKLNQVFSDEIVAQRSRDEILDDLRDAFLSSVGADTQVEVKYDEKSKEANVELSLNVEDMNDRELKYLNLDKTLNVKKLLKYLNSLGLNCKKVN